MSDALEVMTPVAEKFILHWGEMGSAWGINRTVAQVHALLYLSEKPLHAERIATALSVARSNVSNSLRELQGWGVVRVVHVLGDRRDHFESLHDVWEMFRIILEERKRREIDPVLNMLRDCAARTDAKPIETKRIGTMLDFFESMSAAYDEVGKVPPSVLHQIVRARGAIRKLFKGANK